MISNTKGCWSCRARRKRCDGKTPRCNTCDRLGIDCAGFETSRPSWMDGGAEQRAYCGWLKNAVKSARRQQIQTRRKSNSDSSSDLSQAQQPQQWLASPTGAVEVVVPRTAPYQVQTLWTDTGPSLSLKADQRPELRPTNTLNWETDTELFSHGVDEVNLGSLDYTLSEEQLDFLIAEAEQHQHTILSPAPEMPNFLEPSQGNADCEPDWLLLMRYFDHTMQRLFPFHCPIEHVDVRAYLLHIAHRSSVVSTALMSAVLFDFERVQAAAQPQDANSKASVTDPRCLTYYCRASEMIISELETLFNDKKHTSLSCRRNLALEALVSLVHLLLLGVAADDDDVINTRFRQGCQLLELLDSTSSSQASETQSRGQAFFTSIFLRWLVFHRTAQPQEPPWSCLADALQRLPQKNLCGYATSLLETIAQIADLAAWKSGSAAAGVLSTLELAKRAIAIEARVTPFVDVAGMQLPDDDDVTGFTKGQSGSAEPPPVPEHSYHQGCRCCFCSETKATTTIAATPPTCPLHAYQQTIANALLARSAQIFLYTVVSGPNPHLLEIQAVVRSGVQLLRQYEELVGHMAVSWPLAVMMSMAMDGEERELLRSALTACGKTWAYPNEHGHTEIAYALSLCSIDLARKAQNHTARSHSVFVADAVI